MRDGGHTTGIHHQQSALQVCHGLLDVKQPVSTYPEHSASYHRLETPQGRASWGWQNFLLKLVDDTGSGLEVIVAHNTFRGPLHTQNHKLNPPNMVHDIQCNSL